MSIKKLELQTIQELFQDDLKIPPYQRPYKWSQRNVEQLLDDIQESAEKRKNVYRIGTTILHEDSNDALYIVDGQQRLVTITLLLNALDASSQSPLLRADFKHDISKANIKKNYSYIKNWITKFNAASRIDFKQYILTACQFVVITVTDISEAFQLFDSQNARGKPLDPANLLKAFHLREMEQESDEAKLACAKQWDGVDEKKLNTIIGTFLFRIRKWARGEDAQEFTKNDIDEFKGVSLFRNVDLPYLKSYKLLVQSHLFPFQITQMILNGKLFFEYIQHYVNLYEITFNNSNNDADNGFYKFYNDNCCKYNGAQRVGDRYTRALYEALILICQDKFGKNEIEANYLLLYKYVYRLRLEKKQVQYKSIDAYLRGDNNAFKIIEKAYFPYQITVLERATIPVAVHFPIKEVQKNYPQYVI